MLSLTFDLEDPTLAYEPDGRYVRMAHKILDLCDEYQAKATFFTIGKIATSAPDLIRAIADRGHEVAYHSHNHLSLNEETPSTFKEHANQDRYRLQQLAQKPVIGFRAPRYSLTPDTLWALDILADEGFTYSSSVMPTRLSRYGFQNIPHTPFTWACGMKEFPLNVKKIGPVAIPYLGGIYLYSLPSFLVDLWRRSASSDEVLWTYAHPYDFDVAEAFAPMPHTPLWISAVLWTARRFSEKKIRHQLAQGVGPTLGSLIEGWGLTKT